MPGFASYPLSVITTDRDKFAELVDAWNERDTAVSAVPANITLPAAGNACFHESGGVGCVLRQLQNAIEDSIDAGLWVQSHDLDGTARSTGYYDQKSAFDIWTKANIWDAIGISTSGWTRTVNSSGASANGKIATGDRVIVANFNEIYQVLKMLIWSKATVSYHRNSENNYRINSSSAALDHATSRALAEISYDATGAATTSDAPQSIGNSANDGLGGPSSFTNAINRQYQYSKATGIYTGKNSVLETYVKIVKPSAGNENNAFANDGDTLNGTAHVENKYHLVETFSSSTSATRNGTNKIGSGGVPNGLWSTNPGSPAGGGTRYTGWLVGDYVGLLRWNVASGFGSY